MKEPNSSDARPEPVLSVAAPVYNEEQTIEAVVRHWAEVTQKLGVQAEFVLANDGSTDRTVEILERLRAEIPAIRIVEGKENRGYGHALSRAIAACRGRYVATIDSDGQFDLADVEDFLRELQDERCDGVVGYRVRKRDTAARVAADRCLNLLTRDVGYPSAVLFRALDPIVGRMAMRRRVGRRLPLAAGSARVGQALGIGLEQDGQDVTCAPLTLLPG